MLLGVVEILRDEQAADFLHGNTLRELFEEVMLKLCFNSCYQEEHYEHRLTELDRVNDLQKIIDQ